MSRFPNKLILICLVLISIKSVGQNASYYDVMKDLRLVQQNFISDSGQFVACTMTYLYSMESTPQKFLDSLQGQYKSAGHSRYVRIAHTESVQNDSMAVTVYNDDKVIIAAPIPLGSRVNMGQGLMLGNMDSVFISANVSGVTISQKGNQKIMTFRFNDSSQYYNCILIYNATTYVPASLSYILRQTKVAESGKPPQDGNLITVRFSGYSRAAFDASPLNVNKYIQQDGQGKAAVQPAFSSFNVVQPGR